MARVLCPPSASLQLSMGCQWDACPESALSGGMPHGRMRQAPCTLAAQAPALHGALELRHGQLEQPLCPGAACR
jgi:hypothetical protein